MADYLSLNSDTLSEMTRLFAETAIPTLESFEDKAEELQDEQLSILAFNMRTALEEVPDGTPDNKPSSLVRDVALVYKFLTGNTYGAKGLPQLRNFAH
jgi:hypothetical protein